MKKKSSLFAVVVAMFVFVTMLISGCGGGGGGGDSVTADNPSIAEAPIASFSTNVISGVAPLSVQFTDTSTGSPTAWFWDFGDGTSSTIQSPSHVYAAGSYTVTLTVTNGGGTDVESANIIVEAPSVVEPLPAIKAVGFKPVTTYEEKVVIATTESFALRNPQWKIMAQAYIDDRNAFLARSFFINELGEVEYVKKSYSIARCMTYPDDGLENAGKDPAYYYENEFPNKIKGKTFFFFPYANFADIPVTSMRAGLRAAGATTVSFDGKVYGRTFVAEPQEYSVLLGKTVVDQNAESEGAFERMEYASFHESNHNDGSCADEGYNYKWDDLSGISPYLGSYDRGLAEFEDPMSLAPKGIVKGVPSTPIIAYRLSYFNAWLLQKNADQQYSLWEITQGVPAQIWIKVTDAQGYAVAGAQIKLLAAAKNEMAIDNAVNMQVECGAFITDDFGYVKLETKSVWDTYTNNLYIAWGLKAEANGKNSGTTFTVTDLEKAFLQQKQDVYNIELQLQ